MSAITVTFEVSSPEQAALLRQFHGLLEEMQQLALAAPHGRVLDVCEAAVLERGQEVSRQVLEQAVQQRIVALEKKGRRCGRAVAGGPAKTVDRPTAKS